MSLIDRVRTLSKAPEARLLLGVAIIATGIWQIMALGGEAVEGETGAFDKRIMLALRVHGQAHVAIGPPWLGEALRDVSALGGTTIVVLATLMAVAALVFHRSPRRALILAGVVVAAQLADEVFKAHYGRSRPDYALPGMVVYAQSYPSGHSTASAALWFSLAIVAASFERHAAAKAFWFILSFLVVAAVGLSRVYLGVHWPTDVLAGWMLGACFALAGWILWRMAVGWDDRRSPASAG